MTEALQKIIAALVAKKEAQQKMGVDGRMVKPTVPPQPLRQPGVGIRG